MTRHDRRLSLLAACLSAVAGYVDAIGFISLGGFFVSFMSGNTTRVAVGLAEGGASAVIASSLIFLFVVGVVLGAVVGRWSKATRRPMVPLLVCALLVVASVSANLGATRLAVLGMVLAMGAENAVFAEDGEVRIGVTYMTGTLVKIGKGITAALLGPDRLSWAPYLLLWLGLLAGGLLGAAAYDHVGLSALWGAAAASGALSLVAFRIGPDAQHASSDGNRHPRIATSRVAPVLCGQANLSLFQNRSEAESGAHPQADTPLRGAERIFRTQLWLGTDAASS